MKLTAKLPLALLALPMLPRAAKPPRRQTARTAIRLGLTAFLLAQLGLSVAVETVKPEWRDPEFGVRIHRLHQLRDRFPQRPLVVVLGSSRTQMGLRPLEMDFPQWQSPPLVFNFGQAGAGPLLELLTLERVLRDGIKPEYLLVEVFRPTLYGGGPDERSIPQAETRLGLRDLAFLEPYGGSSERLWHFWMVSRIAPWSTYRHFMIGHWLADWQPYRIRMHHTWDQIDSHGSQPFPFEAAAGNFRTAWIETYRGLYGRAAQRGTVGKFADRTLRDLVARCRKEGIAVAFFAMPEGPAFQSWYPIEVKAAINAYLQSLGRELHVPFFDFTAGFAETEFADSHHLLEAGASRFTRKFTKECLRPWLAGAARSP
jgi:hypothetical protein